MHAASDAGLGIVLLAAGAVAFVAVAGMDLGRASRLGPGFFPTVIGWMLLVVGVAELLRAVLLREREDARWSLKSVAIITVSILCAGLAAWWWGGDFTLPFKALEWTALFAFVLSVAIALARVSRTRAAGMVLPGLLLGTVGVDVNTGVARKLKLQQWHRTPEVRRRTRFKSASAEAAGLQRRPSVSFRYYR